MGKYNITEVGSILKQKALRAFEKNAEEHSDSYLQIMDAYNNSDVAKGVYPVAGTSELKSKIKDFEDKTRSMSSAIEVLKNDLNKDFIDSFNGINSQISAINNNITNYDKFFSQFNNNEEFLNWRYGNKYKGKTATEIDDVINNFSSDGAASEKRWLMKNRDYFMTTAEIENEIKALEGQSAELKSDKALSVLDYAGKIIGGSVYGGNTSPVRYDSSASEAEAENNARLKYLKELLATKPDFDAEKAYKEADGKNLWDVITTDYTYADYLNDKDSKNIYGNAVVRHKDEENLQIISDNSELKNDLALYATHVAAGNAGQAASNPFSNIFPGNNRNGYTPPTSAMVEISQKWIDAGYDFYELYDSYKKNYNKEFTEEITDDTSEFIKKNLGNTVLGNVASVGVNVLGGIAALPSVIETGLEDALSDDIVTLDTNAPEWALKNVTDSIRDTTSQMISENNDGIKREFLNLLYTTGMSIADNVTLKYLTGLNPKVMQVIMGTNAAADGIKSVVESGGSVDEAILTGLTSGIFEALFERVSIDNLFRTATSDTGKKLIYNFFKGFLSEGSEELCTEIANTFADALINGNNSEFNNSVYNYMAEGKTAAEARSLAMVDTMKQMGLSFAGGALSGGLIAGVGGGINLMSANSQYSKAGNKIINNGNVDSVMQLADEIVKNQHNEDIEYDLGAIEKYQKGIENKTFRTSGKADINTAVENRLGEFGVTDSKVVDRVTNAFIKGAEYRKTGNATVDKYAARVLSELRSSENATGRENFTNEWASPFVDKARMDAKTVSADKYRARDIGRLAGNVQNAIINSTQENINAEIKKGIQTRVEELGVDKSTSKTAADIVFKAFMGDKLTPGQHRILEKNQTVKRVYNELKSADEVGINEEYSNSWVSPVLENAGILRAVQNVKLSGITGSKKNTVTGDGVIDDVKTDLPDVKTFDSDVKTAPSVINGTEDFDSFVENVRSELMTTGVVKKYSKTEIDNKTAGQIAVLDAYGRKHGLSFIVVDSIGEGDTRANGTYVGKNKVLISLDAEGGALLSVAGHEVYHYIARNNKLGADSIRAFVLSKLKSNDNYHYNERFAELSKQYGTENVDEIEEEMVANVMFELLSDEDVINDLAKENPTLLEKIIAAIKGFIKELKEMAKKLPWAEVAVFQNDIQSLETIKAMAEAALWNIKENGEISSENANKSTASDVSNNEEKVSNSGKKVSNHGKNVSNTESKKTATRDGVVKFNFAEMGMEEFNRQTLNNIKLRGGILINSITELIENIENALNGNVKVNMYLGAISNEVKDRIVSDIGQQIFKDKQYALVVSYDDIVHISEHFGYDVNKITEEILKLYDIIKNYDTVNLEITDKNMKKLVFDKSYSDYDYRTVEIVSNKKNTLDLVTFFVTKNNKKNRSQSVPPAVDNGLQWGSASDTSISQDDTPVNTNYAQKGKDDTNKFSFAGGKAKTANYTRLDEAIRLESEGLSSEEIRQQTGWFRGYDNKWRFEIDDSKMEFSRKGFFTNPDVLRYHELADKFLYGEISDEENNELQALRKSLEGVKLRPTTLGDYVKHDELFKAYPELKNLKVTLRSDMPREDHGSYNSQRKEIILNSLQASDEYAIRNTLMHEIQHAIQDIEGFSGGADSRSPDYVRTAGEVEARDVSKRLGYDAEKRKNTRPDIDREDVVFSDVNVSFSSQNVERYTEKEYNDYGWVAANEVLTGKELKKLYSQFADIQENAYNYPLSSVNEYMILVGNKYDSYEHLVFIKGTNQNPIITRVVGLIDILDEFADDLLWEVCEYEEQGMYDAINFIEKFTGEKIFSCYTAKDFGAYSRRKEERSGTGSADYSRGKQDGRRSAGEDSEFRIKLSLQETAQAGEVKEKLIQENDNLRVANTLLKKEMKLTQGRMLSLDNTRLIARQLTEQYSSDYNNEALAREIYNIFNHYDKTGDYDYLINYLVTVGKRVVARSSAVDNSLYEDYEDARKWVRHMRFALPEHILKQMNENYDGKFVRKTFGRMQYVSHEAHPDAPFLSQIYSELANEYPNFFSIEDNEYEQPMRLIEFWEKIQPTVYNPMNEMGFATEDDAAVAFAFDVFNVYNKTDKLETFADKKKNEIDKLRKEYDRNLERVKKKMAAERDSRLEYQKEYYINAREKSSEGRKKAYVKKKIRNVIKDLDKYLNRGSKDKNVKDDLQETVQTALSTAELLFTEVPSNEDIVRAGVSSFTEKEGIWLDEYEGLLNKKEEYKSLYSENNKNQMSVEFLETREKLNLLMDNVNKRIKYLDKCLEDLFEREKRHVEQSTVSEALSKLAATYSKIKDSEYSYIAQSYNQNVYDKIDEIIRNKGDAKISLLTTKELDDIYVVYKMVLHTVRNANKVFTSEKKETAEELGKIAMSQIREVGGNKKRRIQALDFLKRFGWSELKPVYAFRLIGSDVLQERYAAMRNGEDTYYRDVSHAKEFYAKLRDKYKTDEWKLDKGYEFVSKAGDKFTLTLEQIMSIYAYSRRGDQAVTHLLRGGFVFSDAITVEEKKKGKVIKYKVDDGAAYSLTPEVLGQINHVLDDNKRAFVEEMQKYLSDVMGSKGNEISMKMYGVKLFNEKNYFPLKSSAFYRAFDGNVEGEATLKNAGFSKATTPKANNPIVLDDFTSVWRNHVQDMAMYHSFVLPIEDFTKVFNYESHGAEGSKSVSVKATLQGAYGPSAEQYVRNLLTDLNSGVRSQNGTEFVNKLTGLAKKGAVFASMSVVIQQPSAVVRATAHVNPKYFINAFPQSANWLKVSKEYEELKKYAPVAGIKEMGYFDTGFGKSTAEWITEKEYRGFGKKFQGFIKGGSYRDDIFSSLASKADEVSWVYIWNAVKKEVANTQHLSGEALLNAAGKRFTEVVELTQVYDSVFSRSGLMRSKDTGVKMVTAFMAEPTTQINMLYDAIISGKRGRKKYAAAAFGAVYASILINAMLKAIVTAARDDDDEFSYSEKYISNLISSFISDGSIVSSIPFARDIISLIQGYDVERMDMTVIADIVNSLRALGSDDKSTFDKITGVATSIFTLIGVPAKNIHKDIKAVFNLYRNIAEGYEFSENALKETIYREITGQSTPKADLLYQAIVSGDTEYARRLEKKFTDSGYNSAVREGLKKYDKRIHDAAVARMNDNTAEYMRLAKEIIAEGNFSQDNVVAAINSVINSLTEKEPTPEKIKGMYTDDDYLDAIIGGDGKTAEIVGKELVETDIANGKTQEEAEKSLVSSLKNNIRDEFEAGTIESAKVEKILSSYCNMTETEAKLKVRYWDFKIDYPDYNLSEETVAKYYSEVEPNGINIEVYYDYYVRQKACKSETDSNGKTISGSKKKQILNVIDSLPLTSKQKDVLYFQNNWSESTLDDAPWH